VACSHSIKRYLGEEKLGLVGSPLFKQAAANYRQTGLFYFVNFPDFAAKIEAVNKMRGGMAEPDAYAWLKMIANAKAMKSISGNVRFRDGGVSAVLSTSFDPTQKSPLMEFLAGSGAKIELLHHARRPAFLAFGVSLPEKNRAAAVIGLLDAAAKAEGEIGKLPSDVVKELEQKYKLSVKDDLLGKTRAITVVLPSKQLLPKDTKPLPMLIFHTEDAATATAWLEAFPKIIADLSGAATVPQASSETIGGIAVFSLPGDKLPWNGPVHYAQSGTAVAIGLDRKLVAASVTPDAAAAIVGADKSLLPANPTTLLGVITVSEAVAFLMDRPRAPGSIVPVDDVPLPPGGFPGGGNPVPENLLEDLKKSRKEFLTTLGTLAPATVVVQRTGNDLRIELFQPKVQGGGLKSAIDSGANLLDRWGGVMGSRRQFIDLEGREVLGKW
jgi:hypothetical protein